jgi:hypothetical protein
MEKNLQELIMEHEPHVSLDTANLLKQAGFDWNCQGFYKENVFYSGSIEYCSNYHYQESVYAKAPTLDVAQRWLREVHHLHITIFSSSQESWMFRITKQHQSLEDGVYGEDFYTYEEAQEASIKKALEIILEKGE